MWLTKSKKFLHQRFGILYLVEVKHVRRQNLGEGVRGKIRFVGVRFFLQSSLISFIQVITSLKLLSRAGR